MEDQAKENKKQENIEKMTKNPKAEELFLKNVKKISYHTKDKAKTYKQFDEHRGLLQTPA